MASTVDLRRLRGFKGRNLLHLAVEGSCVTGRLDVCRFLVEEKGFDANSASTEGETPIFVATDTDSRLLNGAEDGIVPLLTYFLSRGGDPAAPDAKGCTPLHNAAQYGHSDAIRLLLSKGVPVDPFYHHGTPLHLAAGNGHDQALKILLEHGAGPNKLIRRVTPLLMACAGASLKCIKLLFEVGADVNFHSSPGPTMLLAAVGAGSADVVNFLLEIGADPNVHDGYGKFPIILAAAHEPRKLVEILLPRTNPISSMPDWSVDGIINTMKNLPRETVLEPIANAKSQGKEAFANGDYGNAVDCYTRVYP
ncbi:uncharacterized protein [Miscanthus floridulus]|uniref:uncharacterized protein n=1 Tax=Miscanthus floridulus TaxID=154761 RepID=UPI00345A9524